MASDVSASEESANAVRVRWTAADARGSGFEIISYRVEVSLQGTVVQSVIVLNDQTSVLIRSLRASTTYEIRVYAITRKGEGSPSITVSATTAKAEEGGGSGRMCVCARMYVSVCLSVWEDCPLFD